MRPNIFKSRKNRLLLREVLREYMEDEAKVLPSLYQPTAYFSPEYEAHMQKLIKKQQKIYYYWINTTPKKVACVLVSLLLLSSIMTFSVSGLREAFLRFIVETYEKFTSVIVPMEENEMDDILTPIQPTYIPEGYTLTSKSEKSKVCFYIYKNSSGDKISYYQRFYENYELDTEDVTYQKVMIDQYEGMFYENKGERKLFFINENVIYQISGKISKEELIAIASSIKMK